MEKNYDLIFLKKLQEAIRILDELDEIVNTNGERQSKVDSEICDYLHLLQNDDTLSDSAMLKISKKIKELRKIRVSLRNEYELISEYKNNQNKMSYKDARQFLTANIQKRMKNLNQPYVNRVITDDDIKNIVGLEGTLKKTRGRKSKINMKLLKELCQQQKTQREIAEELGICQASVCRYLKELKGDNNEQRRI